MASYEKVFGNARLEETRSCALPVQNIKSCNRCFWYQEKVILEIANAHY
jgi:hypothetical protein